MIYWSKKRQENEAQMIRRIIAVLTASVTIISAVSFICFAAGKTVNVKVPAPQAGKSPDFRFEIEDEDFLPGSLPLIAGGFWRDAETAYLTCEGKIPELKEAASYKYVYNIDCDAPDSFRRSALCRLAEEGIIWIEYSETSLDSLYNSGQVPGNRPKGEVIFGCLAPDGYSGSVTGKFLDSSDKFKAGKSYACCIQIMHNYDEKSLQNLYAAAGALTPYYEKESEIYGRYGIYKDSSGAVSEEKNAALQEELDRLNAEYKDEIDAYEKAKGADPFYEGENPVITVNGEKCEDIFMSGYDCGFAFYDFGPLKNKSSFIDMIKEFFENIVAFLKNLFSF